MTIIILQYPLIYSAF